MTTSKNFLKKTTLCLAIFTCLFAQQSFAQQNTCPLNADLLQKSPAITSSGNVNTRPNETVFTRIGKGKNRTVQGVAIDHDHRKLYLLNVTGTPELGVINLFNEDNKKEKIAADAQWPSKWIGHQGIAYDPVGKKIWVSGGHRIDDYGRYVVSFHFRSDNLPTDIQPVKVFPNTYRKRISTMPALSPDGRYLVVRGELNDQMVIRVFDRQKKDFGKYVNVMQHAAYEWPVPASLFSDDNPLQASATDGKYVFLLSGGLDKQDKKLYVFTLEGKPVQTLDHLTLGKEHSLEEKGTWEPEGLMIDPAHPDQLNILFATGQIGHRNARMYTVPICHP